MPPKRIAKVATTKTPLKKTSSRAKKATLKAIVVVGDKVTKTPKTPRVLKVKGAPVQTLSSIRIRLKTLAPEVVILSIKVKIEEVEDEDYNLADNAFNEMYNDDKRIEIKSTTQQVEEVV